MKPIKIRPQNYCGVVFFVIVYLFFVDEKNAVQIKYKTNMY